MDGGGLVQGSALHGRLIVTAQRASRLCGGHVAAEPGPHKRCLLPVCSRLCYRVRVGCKVVDQEGLGQSRLSHRGPTQSLGLHR